MKLGRYEILAELGKGGFGTVYKAEDQVLGRVIALKVLHPSLVIDTAFVDRFRREARLSAQLEHPNLVPVYDLSEIDGRYVITMAYMAGDSLKNLLEKERKLAPERVRQILADVCAGLGYAHAKGIIHRDLKPGNILLDEHGRARVGDLGFARVITDASSLSMSTSGGMVGTPAYMAPELWRNKPASVQTDVYSLGCILYEMLTGKVLFEGTSPAEVMTMHVIDGPQFRNELPAGWHELLIKCLAKDPKNRYNDINAVREAYGKLLTGMANNIRLVIPKVDDKPTEKPFPDPIETQPFLERQVTPSVTRESSSAEPAVGAGIHEVRNFQEAPRNQKPVPEYYGRRPQLSSPHILNYIKNIDAQKPNQPPKMENEKKLGIITGFGWLIGVVALVLVVAIFINLSGKKRLASSPVPSETPIYPPIQTATQTPDLITNVPMIQRTKTANLYEVPSLGLGEQILESQIMVNLDEIMVSPLGNVIVSISHGRSRLNFWDKNFNELFPYKEIENTDGGQTIADISSDGAYLATIERFGINIWDLENGLLLYRHYEKRGEIIAAQFTPDSKRIGFLHENGWFRMLDVISGDEIPILSNQTGGIYSFDFVTDSNGEATGIVALNETDIVSHWSFSKNMVIRFFQPQKYNNVNRGICSKSGQIVKYLPDSQELLVGLDQGELLKFKINGTLELENNLNSCFILDLEVVNNKSLILAQCHKAVSVCDLATLSLIDRIDYEAEHDYYISLLDDESGFFIRNHFYPLK